MDHLFIQSGTSHLLVLALIFGVAIALIAVVRLRAGPQLVRTIRWTLAVLLMAGWALWLILLYAEGWVSVATVLPMHLCDWATIVVTITLVYPNQRTYELGYFWALGGTLQALLTPNLAIDFPDPRFTIFFALHGGVIAAVLLLTFGLRMRPRPASIPRVVAWSLIYLAAAVAVNTLFGTNFGFLTARPAQPSLLDYLAPRPYYIGEMVLLAAGVIALLYAPFFVRDRFAGGRDLPM